MDNFNGYPVTYQYQPNWYYQPTTTTPLYQPRWQQQYQSTAVPQYQQNQNTQQMNNSMVWVQGESGAKAYVLQNGSTLPLWDSEQQTIYIKSVDANGKPSMTILDYTERGVDEQKVEDKKSVEYATKEQIEDLNSQLSSVNKKLNILGKYVTKDQFDSLNGHIEDLSGQISDIEDRLTSFGKPQQTSQNIRRGNNK